MFFVEKPATCVKLSGVSVDVGSARRRHHLTGILTVDFNGRKSHLFSIRFCNSAITVRNYYIVLVVLIHSLLRNRIIVMKQQKVLLLNHSILLLPIIELLLLHLSIMLTIACRSNNLPVKGCVNRAMISMNTTMFRYSC